MNEKRTKSGNTTIQGNASISRNVEAGGNADIRGSMKVGHNLKVEGWLDAPNIKGPMKGLFATEGSLKAAYPRPMAGWHALVGDTLPAELWRAVRDGSGSLVWESTGEMAGEMVLSLEQLQQDVEEMRGDVLELKETADRVESIEESIEEISGHIKKDIVGERNLSDIGTVTARHTTRQLPAVWRVTDGERPVGVMIEYSDAHGHSVYQQMHTSMELGANGCLTPSGGHGPARVYTRAWCREQDTWSPWEESPRMSDVASKADKGMFVVMSDTEYEALEAKDPDVFYYIYEE